MASPSKVCNMAPLNIVSKCDSNLQDFSSTQTASLDELLERCNFDWAEDVEDAVTGDLPKVTVPTPVDYLSKVNLYDEIYPIPRHLTYSKYKSSLPTVYEQISHQLSGLVNSTPDITSSPSTRTSKQSYNDTTDPLTYETPLTDSELGQELFTANSESDANWVAQQSIDNIFEDRQACMDADQSIHHFNWMGLRVYTHSSTSPSDSLAIILAKPKNPQGGDMWRVHSVLNRAGCYIDPVLVFLDDIDESLFELRGSELVRASTGCVFKFYSPHGRWMEDSADGSDETTTDLGNIQTYEAASLAVGNGFVESSAIRSVSDWIHCHDEASDTSGGLSKLPRKSTWERKPSPLRQCESILDEESPEASIPQDVKRAKRPPRKITTCVAGAPREEYFSFPTPTFGRPGIIKKAFIKAQQGLKSVLRSIKHTLR
ncbi:hypothetical protein ACN38_g12758 [Penicillium nordicum]|uniref:Uncharacterized protein n=1 Tax=Penicillium nordicum TaxID=229535 RepID=A0A0M8NP52_9EURO|nr:hypothetical protein ACN38_g12758 [Penicillium nordicum]